MTTGRSGAGRPGRDVAPGPRRDPAPRRGRQLRFTARAAEGTAAARPGGQRAGWHRGAAHRRPARRGSGNPATSDASPAASRSEPQDSAPGPELGGARGPRAPRPAAGCRGSRIRMAGTRASASRVARLVGAARYPCPEWRRAGRITNRLDPPRLLSTAPPWLRSHLPFLGCLANSRGIRDTDRANSASPGDRGGQGLAWGMCPWVTETERPRHCSIASLPPLHPRT